MKVSLPRSGTAIAKAALHRAEHDFFETLDMVHERIGRKVIGESCLRIIGLDELSGLPVYDSYRDRLQNIHPAPDTHCKPIRGASQLRTPYLGHRPNEWQAIDAVLRLFGKSISKARQRYRSFVDKEIALGRRPELTGGGLISFR